MEGYYVNRSWNYNVLSYDLDSTNSRETIIVSYYRCGEGRSGSGCEMGFSRHHNVQC
jgi:hypothetical protein